MPYTLESRQVQSCSNKAIVTSHNTSTLRWDFCSYCEGLRSAQIGNCRTTRPTARLGCDLASGCWCLHLFLFDVPTSPAPAKEAMPSFSLLLITTAFPDLPAPLCRRWCRCSTNCVEINHHLTMTVRCWGHKCRRVKLPRLSTPALQAFESVHTDWMP